MTTKNLSLILLIGFFLFTMACNDSEDPAAELPTEFTDGLFVLNEGAYNGNNASLSYLDGTNNIFNDTYFKSFGADLGDVLQSAYLDSDRLYMVMNGSGTIKAVEVGAELSEPATITGLQQPRYMTISGDNIYVTEWIAFGQNGQLSIIDKSSGEISNSITVGQQPEGIIENDGLIFIANSGSGSVFVLDLASGAIEDTITVGSSPSALAFDAEGELWVLCSGGYDDSYNPLNDGQLMEVDLSDYSITTGIELGMNVSGKMAISPAGDELYYYTGTQVYALSTSATSAPGSPLIEENNAIGFYGIGVAKDGTIYLGDAKDYVSAGEIFRYESNGTLIDKFTVGLLPGGFVFN